MDIQDNFVFDDLGVFDRCFRLPKLLEELSEPHSQQILDQAFDCDTHFLGSM